MRERATDSRVDARSSQARQTAGDVYPIVTSSREGEGRTDYGSPAGVRPTRLAFVSLGVVGGSLPPFVSSAPPLYAKGLQHSQGRLCNVHYVVSNGV